MALNEEIVGAAPGALLSGRDLRLSYGRTVALAGANIEVNAGEIIAISGKSGSGKTSLLYCLAGVLRPDSGDVRFDGRSLSRMPDDAVSATRRTDFGFVFQFGELVPELTVEENVALPLRMVGTSRRSSRKRVVEMLERLGIEDLASRRPGEVSGGQAQRAAVARALVHGPRVVFADEPTGALDSDNSEVVLSQFIELARSSEAAVVLVTHETNVAAVADRRFEVVDGQVFSAATMSDK